MIPVFIFLDLVLCALGLSFFPCACMRGVKSCFQASSSFSMFQCAEWQFFGVAKLGEKLSPLLNKDGCSITLVCMYGMCASRLFAFTNCYSKFSFSFIAAVACIAEPVEKRERVRQIETAIVIFLIVTSNLLCFQCFFKDKAMPGEIHIVFFLLIQKGVLF